MSQASFVSKFGEQKRARESLREPEGAREGQIEPDGEPERARVSQSEPDRKPERA